MEYTVDYFIKKFEAIQEDKWCINFMESNGKKCALGHCYPGKDFSGYTTEVVEACFLFSKNSLSISSINNGNDSRYNQNSPKQRILAALHDIKTLSQPQYPSATTEILSSFKESPESTDVKLKTTVCQKQ